MSPEHGHAQASVRHLQLLSRSKADTAAVNTEDVTCKAFIYSLGLSRKALPIPRLNDQLRKGQTPGSNHTQLASELKTALTSLTF